MRSSTPRPCHNNASISSSQTPGTQMSGSIAIERRAGRLQVASENHGDLRIDVLTGIRHHQRVANGRDGDGTGRAVNDAHETPSYQIGERALFGFGRDLAEPFGLQRLQRRVETQNLREAAVVPSDGAIRFTSKNYGLVLHDYLRPKAS